MPYIGDCIKKDGGEQRSDETQDRRIPGRTELRTDGDEDGMEQGKLDGDVEGTDLGWYQGAEVGWSWGLLELGVGKLKVYRGEDDVGGHEEEEGKLIILVAIKIESYNQFTFISVECTSREL